jgi:ATP-binding cassette subfamily B protein
MSDLASDAASAPAATAQQAREARTTRAVIATLLPFLRPYLGRVALALSCLVAAKLAGLTVPLILKRIVDQLDLEPGLLVVPVALLLAYGAARLSERVFTEMRQIVFARVMARSARTVMLKVFRHLHSLSLRFHLERRTGGVSRDVERGGSSISDLLDWTLYTILPTILEIVLVTTVLVTLYDFGFAAITLAALAAYVAWTVRVTNWRTRFYRAAIEADTAASASAVDSLLNFETVKYFNNEEHEAQRYDASLRKMEEANVVSWKSLAVLNIGQNAIVTLGVTALMWRAASGVASGDLSIGDLVLVNAYLLQLAAPLNFLGMMYREVKQALSNIERLWGLLEVSQDVQDRPAACPLVTQHPTVRFEQVRFGYDARREILHGVDFEIAAGAPLRWSGIRVRASPRCRACSIASTTWTRARSASMAATCATSPRPPCAPPSASFRRTRCCSTTASTTTSGTGDPTPAARK